MNLALTRESHDNFVYYEFVNVVAFNFNAIILFIVDNKASVATCV